MLSTKVLWQPEGYKYFIFDEFSQLSKALNSSPAHLFLCQSIKQFISISHCSPLSLYHMLRQSFSQMKLKIIREWRNHENNDQEKAICTLHVNKLFQSAHSRYYQFYWRPLFFRTFMFFFPCSLQFTWTSKVHFYFHALLYVWCSWRSKEKIWSTLRI